MVWLGTPCSIWSIARRGVRDLAAAAEKDRIGVSLALFSVQVIDACLRHSVYFVIENPLTSRLWQFPPLLSALQHPAVQLVDYDSCAYGAAARKPGRLGGTLPGLERLGRRCRGDHVHEVLAGSTKAWDSFKKRFVWRRRTEVAGIYTAAFCRAVAKLVAAAASSAGARVGVPRAIAAAGRKDLHAQLLGVLREHERAAGGRGASPSCIFDDEEDVPAIWLQHAGALWRRHAAGRRAERAERKAPRPAVLH